MCLVPVTTTGECVAPETFPKTLLSHTSRTQRRCFAKDNRAILSHVVSGFCGRPCRATRTESFVSRRTRKKSILPFRIVVSPQFTTRALRTNERFRVSRRLRKRFPRVLFPVPSLHVNVIDEYHRVSFSNRPVESFGRRNEGQLERALYTVIVINRHYSMSENSRNKRLTVVIAHYKFLFAVLRKNKRGKY